MTKSVRWPGTPTGIKETEGVFLAQHRQMLRRRQISMMALNILGIVAFLGLWEILPRVGLIGNVVLFPPPSTVVKTMWPMILSGEILHNIVMSLSRAISGYTLATVLGVTIGVVTARNRTIRDLLEPLLHGFRSVPAIAVVPISVLWFGIG